MRPSPWRRPPSGCRTATPDPQPHRSTRTGSDESQSTGEVNEQRSTNSPTNVRTGSSPHRSALHRGRKYRSKGHRPDRHDNGGGAQSVADRSKAPHAALYLGLAHRAGARGLDHLLWRNRHADPKAWIDGCHRCGSARRYRRLLRCRRQCPWRHQSCSRSDGQCAARCGGTASGCQLQFGARPGVHRRLRLQRVRGADHHGSRPLAQRSGTTLARSSLRLGF